jgi:DNA-binding NtrC family response regulator
MTLGGSKVETTNARVIAATNVDLVKQVAEGAFREDLFYRLQVVTIHVPPLRERKDDLDDLVPTLLARINREMHRSISRVAADVMDAFHAYAWPGNVRELENVLMKAAALCPGDIITHDLLPGNIAGTEGGRSAKRNQKPVSELSLDEVQRDHVARVLAATNWHRGRSCEILGISRPRLRRLISQFGLMSDGNSAADGGNIENGGEAK